MDAITQPPTPTNEPIRTYAPGTAERDSLTKRVAGLAGERAEITLTVGGTQRMGGGRPFDVIQPHRHVAVLGTGAQATNADVEEWNGEM